MIRRNIISGVGICAALAVGIALGGGPLSTHESATPAAATVHTDPAVQQAATFGQKWAAEVGPDLYAGRLAGERVALITLPGVPRATVQHLTDGIGVAKGTPGVHLTLTQALLNPNRKVAIDALGTQYAHQSHGTVNPQLSTYQRLGQMLGIAVAGAPPQPGASAERRRWGVSAATTAQETLRAAKLAGVTNGPTSTTLALVVTGPEADPQIVSDLVRGLATKVAGVVVTGGEGSAEHGVLAGLRQQKWSAAVMTVDGDDTVYGRTAVIAGLVAQKTPRGGAYGASGIDGLVPLG